MALFRVFLVVFLAALLIYTGIVVANHGANLFPDFFNDMKALAWPGQFNLDFMGFLVLSGLWTAWRYHFSPTGLGLGVLAFFGGMVFQCIHLLWLSTRTGGDIKRLLIGDQRAAA